jgi:hypothetical protein
MTDRPPMRSVSHTPPHDDTATGRRLFVRGDELAADGGERDASTAAAEAGETEVDATGSTMADVDHTAPDGEGAGRVWVRGLPKPRVPTVGPASD